MMIWFIESSPRGSNQFKPMVTRKSPYTDEAEAREALRWYVARSSSFTADYRLMEYVPKEAPNER